MCVYKCEVCPQSMFFLYFSMFRFLYFYCLCVRCYTLNVQQLILRYLDVSLKASCVCVCVCHKGEEREVSWFFFLCGRNQ